MTQGDIKWLPVGNLEVKWSEAQRGLKLKAAQKIADEFDPDVFGVITVTPSGSGNRYHIADGQTRVTAVRILYGEKETVPCLIAHGSGKRRAAELFLKTNTNRAKPEAIDLFRVNVTAAHEPYVSIDRLLNSLGFRIRAQSSEGSIRAVNTLLHIVRRGNLALLRDSILALREVWGKQPAAYEGSLLHGTALLLGTYGDAVQFSRLAGTVGKRFSPERFLGIARSDAGLKCQAVPEAICARLVREYNSGLRLGKLNVEATAVMSQRPAAPAPSAPARREGPHAD
jgi:hypothetical protein